jgi:hypothetical protein
MHTSGRFVGNDGRVPASGVVPWTTPDWLDPIPGGSVTTEFFSAPLVAVLIIGLYLFLALTRIGVVMLLYLFGNPTRQSLGIVSLIVLVVVAYVADWRPGYWWAGAFGIALVLTEIIRRIRAASIRIEWQEK